MKGRGDVRHDRTEHGLGDGHDIIRCQEQRGDGLRHIQIGTGRKARTYGGPRTCTRTPVHQVPGVDDPREDAAHSVRVGDRRVDRGEHAAVGRYVQDRRRQRGTRAYGTYQARTRDILPVRCGRSRSATYRGTLGMM